MNARPGTPAGPAFAAADPPPIQDGETFCTYTDPLTLAPGHPLRGSRCLVCGSLIGGQSFRFVEVIIAATESCHCGQLPIISRMMCADHGEPDAAMVVPVAIHAIATSHPRGGNHMTRGTS